MIKFDREKRPLLGIRDPTRRDTLLEQIMESIHRVKYVSVIHSRQICEQRRDPSSELFDPLKAAILYQREGNLDEAFWLIFLFVHFGKHSRAGWRYVREIYGRLGDGARWDWPNVSTRINDFRDWLHQHQAALTRKGVPRGFGNHRKYESLDARSSNGTGAVVESYVSWVRPPRTHKALIDTYAQQVKHDPRKTFDMLYRSMKAVTRFGRTARFDYLTMLGKLQLANIEPGVAYMHNSTGPIKGARLLFDGKTTATINAAELEESLVKLDDSLQVGMQVLEDALCNWQKSPSKFDKFRG